VLIFGGVSSSMAMSDAWILDLRWREPGVQQYDGTAEKNVEREMAKELRKAASTPLISRYTSPSSKGNDMMAGRGGGWGDDGSLDERAAFLKVRRENALAALTAQSEREKANHALSTINRLTKELNEVKLELKMEREGHEEEIKELKLKMDEILKREEELKASYDIAFRKLQLSGLDS